MDKNRLIEALTREGNLCFPANKRMADILQEPLTRLKSEMQDGATLWFEGDKSTPANIRIKIYPTGHKVFYNTFGRRFLMTDPEGNPLHEAEWEADAATHEIKLKQARCQLDCQQWVGIKPRAKKFSTHISIKGQPGWETMSLDQLRQGAAQAWQVPHSEVEYFYKDENFVSTAEGEYDVNLLQRRTVRPPRRHLRNAGLHQFHVRHAMGKAGPRFPWSSCFNRRFREAAVRCSSLSGACSRTSRGKHPCRPCATGDSPPTPSKEAFNIFSAFFIPKGPAEENIMDVFMDTDRSHEIEWTPRVRSAVALFQHGAIDESHCAGRLSL